MIAGAEKDNFEAIICEIADFNCVFKDSAVVATIACVVPPAAANLSKFLLPLELIPVPKATAKVLTPLF